MFRINTYLKRKHSKKGFTLVEVIAAITIFAIVTVGVLNAVAFSREMIYSNNSRDKASEKAQLLADEIITVSTGVEPSPNTRADIIASLKKVTEEAADGTTNTQVEMIGSAMPVEKNADGDIAFITPDSEGETSLIQYYIEPVHSNEDDFKTYDEYIRTEAGKDVNAEVVENISKGWNIVVRVYYKNIGGGNTYRAVDVEAFAPYNIIGG